MPNVLLSINAGSSSVKVSVYDITRPDAPAQLAEAQVDGLTAPPPQMKYSRAGQTIFKARDVPDGTSSQIGAFKLILNHILEDDELPAVSRADDIAMACHRVVHGGDYAAPQPLTPDTLHRLEALAELAPLHNGPALEIVRACIDSLLPRAVRNIAVFDSQFHATLPPHVRAYPIDPARAAHNGLRKYGFHGISYAFILRETAAFLGKPQEETSIIALHLGSGASACAIKNGRSCDTSMGLTPLAGLPGATRSGSVDPSLVFHFAADVGKMTSLHSSETSDSHSLHVSHAEQILNKESGWKALTGTTDFGRICKLATGTSTDPDGNDDRAAARLALDLMVDRIAAFVGSYYVSLGGQVDALVFAGGIGERSVVLRARVAAAVACLGFDLDGPANERVDGDADAVVLDVSGKGRKVLVCRTDEQLQMARICAGMGGE